MTAITGTPGHRLMKLVDGSNMERLWVAGSGKQALGFNSHGVGLFRLSGGSTIVAWEDVTSLSRSLDRILVVGVVDGSSLKFPFEEPSHLQDLIESVPAEHRRRIEDGSSLSASRPGSIAAPRQQSPAPSATPSGQGFRPSPTPAGSPVRLLSVLLAVGCVLAFVAGIVLELSGPSVTFDVVDGFEIDEGHPIGEAVGYLLLGAGGSLTSVSLIGFGVRLGILAARSEPTVN